MADNLFQLDEFGDASPERAGAGSLTASFHLAKRLFGACVGAGVCVCGRRGCRCTAACSRLCCVVCWRLLTRSLRAH